MNSIVRIPAVLHSMGNESRCTLEMWQERSSTGRVFTRCRIIDDSPSLPDGPYQVRFGDQAITTRKFPVVWELSFIPHELHLDRPDWLPGVAG